ncbi:MAG: hypothetical protein P8M25_06340, partial [Paracoccaceae bacterium]|nr:hypothetical protein [Paracoccaceae bacterium]
VELLRQRPATNNFNYQKRLDKGQLLGQLLLIPYPYLRAASRFPKTRPKPRGPRRTTQGQPKKCHQLRSTVTDRGTGPCRLLNRI